jgi:maltooligosyltrehalose trehalohydrolase
MTQHAETARRHPVGAETTERGVSFRVWAPGKSTVEVVFEDGGRVSLEAEPDGYFSALAAGQGAGARYRISLDGGAPIPDIASRSQPDGVFGASEVVDPRGFVWTDGRWKGVPAHGQVLYELHVGTFTPEGTFRAAIAHLARLAEIGITVIEMMPVNTFPGRFGWGYDGVLLYAPAVQYGTPDDLRAFIDAAHGAGIGVILDVVYNHIGPTGNIFHDYARDYFAEGKANDWGEAINFDGPNSRGVRDFFAGNAAYWIDEFHFDGFRIDATQALDDTSDEHIVAELTRRARVAAGDRTIYVIGENEPQHARLVRPADAGGDGLDSVWNDDFHHAAMVALTGRNEAYYHDYAGRPQEFIASAKYGYLYQGQRYDWQNGRRGTPGLDVPPTAFVHFLQNHDQIANSARGLRMGRLSTPGQVRAATAMLLLLPQTPMLFQGQEFGASTPFFYMAEHGPKLDGQVKDGRARELSQFPSITDPAMVDRLAVPADESTFLRSKLDWSELERNVEVVALHRDLLRLRREDPTFSAQRAGGLDGSVLGAEAFFLRYFGTAATDDRLVVINFGRDLPVRSIADPLSAPPEGCDWSVIWSSEDPAYGGGGTPPVDMLARWTMPGHAALVFAPVPAKARSGPSEEEIRAWQKTIL